MTNAYSDLYIEKAQICLGDMLHYAVYDLRMELTRFYGMFINTEISESFGRGDPRYTVGMSGIELARKVVLAATGEYPDVVPDYTDSRTPEYWTGWAVAYYEWYRSMPFDRIDQYVPVSEIIEMYNPYHEMDITGFVNAIDSRISERQNTSRLARLRSYAEMSQKALAERSGVSVRMIEQYEQGRKDINHASSKTVLLLSRALGCRMEDLMD